MNHYSIEELLPKANGSMYRLVRMASKRAQELSDGSPALIAKPSGKKFTTIALEEIATGKLEIKGVTEN